jgi:Spy/CpxP family protein refolding chaperone
MRIQFFDRQVWIHVAILALVVPTIAFAQVREFRGGHRARPGPDAARFIEKHGEELGLEPEERSAIQAIADSARGRAEELRQETEQAEQVLRELLSEAAPDQAAVMEQSDRIEAIRARERRNRLEAMLEIRSRLTPEQRDRLVEIRTDSRRGDRARGGPRFACRRDLARLCGEAVDGREKLRCLDSHWEDLSEPCRTSFDGAER